MCLLFAWFLLPFNVNAGVTAIGTGTVKLDYTKVTPPAGGLQTHTLSCLGETCIDFTSCASVDWEVTFVAGVYDIDISYGTQTWGFNAKFSVVDPSSGTDVAVLYDPAWETSGAGNTEKDFSVQRSSVEVNVTTGKTYYVRVTGGNSGLCVGHISFTPKVGVVMAAFGQSADGGPTTLPDNGSNAINGITVTTNMELDLCNSRTYDYLFDNESTDYVDISVGDDQVMTSLATSVLYDGSCTGGLYIKFSSSATFDEDALVGTPILLSGLVFANFYTYPPSTSSVSLPSGTIKSARIYRNGSCQWGTRLYRIEVEAEADECTKKTVSFVKEGTETGSAPGEIEVCEDASITIPGKGSLSKTGNVFAGWNDGSDTYQEGDSYDMSGSNHTFTAVWTPIVVPVVTNLAITDAVNNTIPLSWSIPGKLDLSTASTDASYFYHYRGPATSFDYDPASEELSVTYDANAWDQKGVAFPIVLSNLETITFESKGHRVFPEAIYTSETKSYWEYDPMATSDDWETSTMIINTIYPNNGSVSSVPNVDAITFCANPSDQKNNETFYIRNVFYHLTDQIDVDHVVLMRKEGSASTGLSDGIQIYSGKNSHFTDEDDKTPGTTYYYTVFAVDAEGNVSAAVYTSHTIENVATCTVSYENGDGVGDAPIDATEYAEGNEITLPAIGTVYKPFSAFTGWKKGNAGDLLAAGSTYTVTAADVEAETISFTAQWEEDNTTRRIPAEHILNYSNQSTSVATTDYWEVTGDSENDICLDMRNQTAEWRVFIEPGYYDISTICAVPYWGISYRLSIVDPLTDAQVMELFYEHTSGDENTAIIRNLSKMFDLTSLVSGKQYIIRVKDTWPNCGLLVHDINITKHAPIEIPDETHFDKDNAFSSVTTATDMDIDGEAGNDELINLDRKYVEWDVKVAPGVYNVSLVYGAPQYSIKVLVALIDPENPESVIYLSKDGNHTYYYKSGSQNTPHHYTSTTKCDLTEIDGNKTYRLRISDEYDGSNYLRVKDLTFAPVAPIAISNVTNTRLDATHTIQAPVMATDLDIDDDSNMDELMNLYNTNAEWLVTVPKGLYNVQLVYGAPDYSIKVAVKLIDPTGEEADRVLSIQGDKDYYEKSNPAVTEEDKATTPHHYTSATKCALLDVTEDKIYKVRVADVYPKCNLRVSHVLFTPIAPLEIHEEASLDASNVMIAPSIVDSRIDISNQKEAVWYATIDPHKYDITLTYSAVSGDTKVRFAIIPVGGDTIFVHQENQHNADNTTYTIQALDQNLTGIASGICKIIVKDNYGHNGSKPQIISLTFSRAITTHTRSGLNVGDYGTVCLPYAIEAANINGAEIYKLIEWPAGSCAVTLELVDNMEAGHPYIYQATANTATWSYYAEGDPTGATSENGLIGSYTTELLVPNANNYVIYNNKLYYVDSEAYVGANRAYINRADAENAPTPGPANGRKRIQLAVNGAQVVTGMDQINDQLQVTKFMENGILYIIRDGKIYNAQGQLVK